MHKKKHVLVIGSVGVMERHLIERSKLDKKGGRVQRFERKHYTTASIGNVTVCAPSEAAAKRELSRRLGREVE